MRADRVEVSWDAGHSSWLVRVEAGEEVIRRHFKASQSAGEPELLEAARRILQDEGYEAAGAQFAVVR